MRKTSKLNMITLSNGEKITSQVFHNRVSRANRKKKELCIEDHGYLFCHICFHNNCIPVDPSHDISVKKCIENGTPELAYDLKNITLRGRNCHNKHDTNILQWTKKA